MTVKQLVSILTAICIALSVAPALALDAEQTEALLSIFEEKKENPRTFDDFDKLATIAYARGMYEEALGYIDECVTLAAGDTALLGSLWTQKGVIYQRMEDPDAARKAYNTAAGYAPDNIQLLLARADLASQQRDYSAARKDLEHYLTLLPEDADVWGTLAQVYKELKWSSQQKDAQQQHEALKASDTSALMTTARKSAMGGDLQGARNSFLQCLELTRDEGGEVHFLLASVRMELGEIAEAIIDLESALALGYKEPGVCYEYLSSCYFVLGEYQKVLEASQKVIDTGSKAPAYDTLYQRMGISALSLSLVEEAISYFTKSIASNDDLLGNHYYRALGSMSLNDYEGAIADLGASIDRGELAQRCLYNRGLCYIQTDRMAEAISDLNQAMDMTDEAEIATAAENILWQLTLQSITETKD